MHSSHFWEHISDQEKKCVLLLSYLCMFCCQVTTLIVPCPVSELKFVQDAAELARNLTTLRQRSWRRRQRLEELKERVRQQMEELWRAEVRRGARGGVTVAASRLYSPTHLQLPPRAVTHAKIKHCVVYKVELLKLSRHLVQKSGNEIAQLESMLGRWTWT